MGLNHRKINKAKELAKNTNEAEYQRLMKFSKSEEFKSSHITKQRVALAWKAYKSKKSPIPVYDRHYPKSVIVPFKKEEDVDN